jgi:parallel beta-helix repeat protein
MKKRAILILFGLLVILILSGCGDSEADQAARATELALAIEGTLTAQAPPPTMAVITVVVTPEPPAATDTPAPEIQPSPAPTETPVPPPTEPPPAPQPTETAAPPSSGGDGKTDIFLAPAGGGDYPSLAEAVRNAAPGGRIVLEAGIYPLDAPVTIDKALSLAGAGDQQTVILSASPEYVLQFQGPGPFWVENIAFRHDGTEPANVVVVLGGEASFYFCSFSGGVFSTDAGYGGNGLFLGGSTRGQVYDCEAMRNQEQGILLREGAQITIEHSDVHHNGGCGIGYFGEAAGTALSNEVAHNGLHGICLSDTARPLLEGNTCRHNDSSGMVYFAQAGGEARQNDCSLNGKTGISVQGQAQPLLEGNRCFANGETDIAYYENGSGTAQGNFCSTDAPFGLYVAESAGPSLLDNRCSLSGAASQAGGGGMAAPQYNPDFLEGYGPICFNRPQPAIDREWQTAAGTREVLLGDSVELSLRNKWGGTGEVYQFTVRVTDPEGTTTSGATTLTADQDAIVIYPDDFPNGSSGLRGTYTVVWEIDGGFVACDGFITFGGASW